jgi:hypothetical protein
MVSHDFASQMMKLQELANLVGISSRQQDLVAPFLELLNDGYKERDVGRVIYINPDLLSTFRTHATLKIPYGQFPEGIRHGSGGVFLHCLYRMTRHVLSSPPEEIPGVNLRPSIRPEQKSWREQLSGQTVALGARH